MDQNTPAVSPLMIAENLIEQFDDVLVSLKDGVERTGQYESGYDGATVFIAEGNRVYPAIWEHLDIARSALAKGSSALQLTGYDALRSHVDRSLGIWDFESKGTKQKLTGAVQVFTWKHNSDGIAAASEACAFLMNMMPEVDWDAQRRAVDEVMVDLRSGDKSLMYMKIGAALAAAGGVAWLILS